MAASEYTHGEMNIESQKKMYAASMKASAWGALIVLLGLGYATLSLSIGIHWLVSLILMAGAGIAIGAFMGFGGAWVATIVGLSALALFIQVLIILFSMAF